MQLHVNDQPSVEMEAREMPYQVLSRWTTDWRSAEVWENGICRYRLPMVSYSFVVVAWTENGIGHVNIYDVESDIVQAYQSGTIRLV